MADKQVFPEKFEDFLKQYSFEDKDQHYTNGCSLIPTFRVLDALEHYFPDFFKGDDPDDEPDCVPHFTRPQSADEMFADLGYSGTPSGCYDRFDGMKSIEFYGNTSEPDSFVVLDLADKYEVTATYDEILAIAQKIKEMEAQNE